MERSINSRLLEALRNMKNPIRDTNAYQYKYATIDQVIGIVQPALMEQNLFVQQGMRVLNDGATILETRIVDGESDKDFRIDERVVRLVGDARKDGSMETYMRRYALLTAFGLAPTDDDGGAASQMQQTRELEAAKRRVYQATEEWAKLHNADHKKIMQGISKRPEYQANKDNPAWFDMIAEEFRSDIGRTDTIPEP